MTAPTTPARRAALLRLLEDWEAGRMTSVFRWRDEFSGVGGEFNRRGLIAWTMNGLSLTLTPAGLEAARAERGKE